MNKKPYKIIIRIFITILLGILAFIFYNQGASKFVSETSFMSIPIILGFTTLGILFSLLVLYKNKWLFEIGEWMSFITISTFFILIIFSFILLPSNVNQSSMFPTLENGDRILIYHYQYEPEREDIVVVEMDQDTYPNIPTDSTDDSLSVTYYVKRLKGLPGDTLTFERTQLLSENFYIKINGEYMESPTSLKYTLTNTQRLFISTQLQNDIIPDSMYFVLGDNAVSSLDSRAFGLVYERDLMGNVIFGIWPFGAIS